MSGNIFVSYRRSNGIKDARALYERLRREFGEHRVFVDLEGIEPGEDFIVALDRQLDGCEVLVVIIGSGWADARNEAGERRLDDPNDFVRIELRAALARGIKVFPVLIDGAQPPKLAELPVELQSLARRQAIALDYAKFDGDVARLARAIRKALEGGQAPALSPVGSPATAAATASAAGASLGAEPGAASHDAERSTTPPGPALPRWAVIWAAPAVAIVALGVYLASRSTSPTDPPPDAATKSARAASAAVVTDAQIQAEYDRLKGQASGTEYRVRHILVESEEEAKSLIRRIKAGASFQEMARQYSKDPGSAAQGGDLDFAKPDSYVLEFGQAMVKLKIGEMTQEPVKTQFGYHLILLESTRAADFPPLPQVKAVIAERLRQAKTARTD